MGWYVGLLAVPGLGLILLDRTRKRRFAYVVLNLLAFGTLVTVAYNPRFSLVLIPFYAFLSLKTLAFIRERGARSLRIAGGLVPAVVLIVVALTFVDSVRFNRGQIDKGPRHVLKTAEWFRTRVPERYRKGIIVARKPHIAYYLDLDFRWIPDVKTYDDLIASLKAMRAEYLYFSLIEAHWRPELASLLNPNLDHPGLVPLMYVGKPPVSVLYKVSY